MSNYEYVHVLELEPGQTEAKQSIKTPFSNSLSEWSYKSVHEDSECSIKLSEHSSGFKMRTYKTARVIVIESNWKLEENRPNELTPKQP